MKKTLLLIGLLSVFLVGCGGTQPLLDPSEYEQEPYVPEPLAAGEGTSEGDHAPDFTVTTIDGKTVSLSSFTTAEKPVLLYFMATWCPFCAKDYAALSELYNQYDVEILSIDLDLNENADVLRAYKKKFPALDKMMFAPGSIDVLAKYQVRSTTTKYAINSRGNILYKGSGAFSVDQWALLLQALESS